MARENTYVLKVLAGAQAGAEVSLVDAEYVLGSGPEDDLHFVDVSLKPGHARLRLEDGVINAAGGAGTVATRAGISILAGDETWQEIEALDVITIGTTSFAIGSPSADWSNVNAFVPVTETKKISNPPPIVTQSKWGIGRFMTVSVILVATLLSFGWLASGSSQDANAVAASDERPDLAIVTSALDAFPFSDNISVTQEVDGIIEAVGYVGTTAERRALRNAVDETAIPVRFRVWSRSVIENETRAIVENQQIPVEFSIGNDGVLTLRGDVLDETRVERLVEALSQNVVGVADINVQVQTANDYLEQIRALLARSELEEGVIVRLDGLLVEANGVVVAEKIDNWVGFIQSYARRYADKIALRSFVQLVDENGDVIADPVSARPGQPVIVGSLDALGTTTGNGIEATPVAADPSSLQSSQVGVVLDLARLREGSFGPEEVFEGFSSVVLSRQLAAQQSGAASSDGAQQNFGPRASQPMAAQQPTAIRPQLLNRASRPESIRGTRVLFNMTKAVLSEGTGVAASTTYRDELAQLGDVEATLAQMKYLWGPALGGDAAQDHYLNLLVTPTTDFTECWDNSIAAFGNLPYTLFWLDYLSVSDEVDISIINLEAQVLLLEAALNPSRLSACAARLSAEQDIDLSALSLYLQESHLNPEFIRFIVRGLNAYPIDLSGVNMGFQNRYAQLTTGTRFNEGEQPEPSSLLVNVGELGLLIKEKDRLLVTVYDASLHWKSGG